MNCKELNQSIKDLESELKSVSETVDEFSELEEMDKKQLVSVEKELSELEAKRDKILETNLDEFFEKHPGLFYVYEERITGFYNGICTSERLSDTEILVMGRGGETKILKKEDGKWKYDKEISGFNNPIKTSMRLSDTEILVMGGSTMLQSIDGEWSETSYGEAKILNKTEDGWEYGDEIFGFDEEISASMRLSDTEILVMGHGGETKILNKTEDGWEYGKEIPGFGVMINTSLRLSDAEILVMSGDISEIGEYCSEAKILNKTEDGWEYGDEIPRFDCYIDASEQLSDSEILVMGEGGEAGILKKEKNLESLKKNLEEIIESKKVKE